MNLPHILLIDFSAVSIIFLNFLISFPLFSQFFSSLYSNFCVLNCFIVILYEIVIVSAREQIPVFNFGDIFFYFIFFSTISFIMECLSERNVRQIKRIILVSLGNALYLQNICWESWNMISISNVITYCLPTWRWHGKCYLQIIPK